MKQSLQEIIPNYTPPTTPLSDEKRKENSISATSSVVHFMADKISSTLATTIQGVQNPNFPFDEKAWDKMNQTELQFMFMSILEYLHSLTEKYCQNGKCPADIEKQIQKAYNALKNLTQLANFKNNTEEQTVFNELPDFNSNNFAKDVYKFNTMWTSDGKGGLGIFDKYVINWMQKIDYSQFDNEDWSSSIGMALSFAMTTLYISLASDPTADHGSARTIIDAFFQKMLPGNTKNLLIQGLAIYFYQLDGKNWDQALKDLQNYFDYIPSPPVDSDKKTPLFPAWSQTYKDLDAFLQSNPSLPDYCQIDVWDLILANIFQCGEGN